MAAEGAAASDLHVQASCKVCSESSFLSNAARSVLAGYRDQHQIITLALYREVLVMVMRKHQRYFPVYSQGGEELLPYFITVANGLIHPPTVIAGS